jgi:DnaJ family protein C protein 3
MCFFVELSSINILFHLAFGSDQETAKMHMEKGNAFLSKGQFADALNQYHSAVELHPNDYQIYFRRATVLLATGKVKAALPDLDRVVELKPDFVAVSVFV